MKYLTGLFLLAAMLRGSALDSGALDFKLHAELGSSCSQVSMTMLHDRMGRPYLYVANKEAGLKVYDISSLDSPRFVTSVPITQLDSLDVMNLSQLNQYLYLATGNHFNNKQHSGMAVIDVSDPRKPVVSGKWFLPGSRGGSGVIKAEGNYAYLGAMGNGLIILDVSDIKNIKILSRFKPDINFPTPKPKPSLYNARGMWVKNGIVYLCFDAGGLRIINTTDKSKPRESGRFSNPVMNGKPRAYNNIVLDDSLVYITVDYCGLEILNVSDTAHIKLRGWWNPCGCPGNNWFKSPVHANEICFQPACKRVFVSTGKSDMQVIDVNDHAHPNSIAIYGGVDNKIGTWGIDLYKDEIFLSYVCSVVPFSSNWSGIRVVTFQEECK